MDWIDAKARVLAEYPLAEFCVYLRYGRLTAGIVVSDPNDLDSSDIHLADQDIEFTLADEQALWNEAYLKVSMPERQQVKTPISEERYFIVAWIVLGVIGYLFGAALCIGWLGRG